jgi:hypothetical protein
MDEMTKQRDWTKEDWLNKSYGSIGERIAEEIGSKGSDEELLKSLADKAIRAVKKREESPGDRQSAMSQIARGIHKTFPRSKDELPNYWYDSAGRATLAKWRHNIFKYLTIGRGIKQSTEKPDEQTVEVVTQQKTEPKQVVEPQSKQEELTLKNMTIEQLELDAETVEILEDALEQSGMDLAQFIQQAVRVYAKTITGKTKKRGEDLATVPTDKLLNDPSFNTHPGRAEELTKRAIQAIKYFNANVAVESSDRWCITQSAIAKLTGSKPATIGKILEQYKDEIETHNQTYGLNDYSNRKRDKKIEDLKFAEYVLDGLG